MNKSEESDVLSRLCGQPAWEVSASTWSTDEPELGICLERTLLLWVPCVLFWLIGIPHLVFLRRKIKDRIPWTALAYTRTMCAILLVVTGIVELFWVVLQLAINSPRMLVMTADIFASIILCITYVLQLVIVLESHRRSVQSNTVIWLFSLMMFLCSIPEFKTISKGIIQRYLAMSAVIEATFMIQFFTYITMVIAQTLHDSPSKIKHSELSKNASPEQWASLPNRMTFSWAFPLMWKGFRSQVTHQDLYDLPNHHTAPVLSKTLIKYIERNEKRVINKKTSIAWMLASCLKKDLLITAILYAIYEILSFFSPEILSVDFQNDVEISLTDWIFYLIFFFRDTELNTISVSNHNYSLLVTENRMENIVVFAASNKALRLSAAGRQQVSLGEIVNLMAVDTFRVAGFVSNLYPAFGSPFVIATALILLWERLGPAVLAGLVVCFLQIPINTFVANKVKNLQGKHMTLKDKRLKIITEVINGIKVLKMYAWEESFKQQVEDIRAQEIVVLKRLAIFHCNSSFFFNVTPTLVALASFATFLLMSSENSLDAETAFVSLALFNILRLPLIAFPNMITDIVQAKVSMERMDKFLAASELDLSAVSSDSNKNIAVLVKDSQFIWNLDDNEESSSNFKLQDMDISLPAGSLLAVVGTVGAGKSSFISALLGEMNKIKGQVVVNGRIAYVSQSAWLQNATLQDNITFGEDFDPQRYKEVVKACALQPDLDMLPAGDQTEIGEKGINLSGGQKQRISMARAVYSNADIYLLDDPLSAVDAHVGKHMFEYVIGPNGLLKNKTRILVTHGVSFLPEVDSIIVMKAGAAVERGSYAELLQQDGDFAQFLLQHQSQVSQSQHDNEENGKESEIPNKVEEKTKKDLTNFAQQKSNKNGSKENEKSLETKGDSAGKTLVKEEKTQKGGVSSKVFLMYGRAMGLLHFILPLVFLALAQASTAGGNLWLSYCANQVTGPQHNGTGTFDRDGFLAGYAGFGLLQAIFVAAGTIMVMLGCLKASLVLHQQLVINVLHLPMNFFDSNPSGRIINRFSKEVDTLDSTLPGLLRIASTYIMQVIFTLIVIIISTPIAASIIVPVMVIYCLIQRMFVAMSRQLKRIEAVSKSPIFSHFSETVQGLSVIRAFQKQEEFQKESLRKIDYNMTVQYNDLAISRWLACTLETIGNLITFAASMMAVLSKGDITPGNVGLSITYALSITLQLNWVVQILSSAESNITSVERIYEYIEEEQEAPWRLQCSGDSNSSSNNISGQSSSSRDDSWPQKGEINFSDYELRYRPDLPLVLNGITCTIKASEKIGIVGRTGAGKSSLTTALFRLVEPAGGSISIDGINVATIGLHDLREKLTIIPQDAVLFCGSLRLNLDPFNLQSDADVWKALEHVNLKTFVSSQPDGLEFKIDEGGSNLSVGQRQLLCLGRALVRQSRILILDEATASVDLDTDDFLQDTIRREFKDCTIITIAHRLKTVMDSDKILVLDAGNIAEFDSPSALLANTESLFYGLAKESGLVLT
ncbi:unnamed protein product, partial [Meganyctiphanes norvegica]